MAAPFSSTSGGIRDALDVAFDNTGTGLAADDVQNALAELDSIGTFTKLKEPISDVTVLSGQFKIYFALAVKQTVMITVEQDADLWAA